MHDQTLDTQQIIATTQRWMNDFVVQLQLCPFAGPEIKAGRVRVSVSQARNPDQLLQALTDEFIRLNEDADIGTTVLVHPFMLTDFFDFNQFLDACDALLLALDLEGIYQIASFHPQYQFAGTQPDDAENFSNRSPYPMLHLLREDHVEQAVAGFADVQSIPARNMQTLGELGTDRLAGMWAACFDR